MNKKLDNIDSKYSTLWILRLTFTYLLFILSILPTYAENTIKEKLEQHVYTLASDEMKGRKSGTKYARMAAEYIINQLEEIGIEPFFDNSYIQPFKFAGFRFKNIAGVIYGNDPVLKEEYIVIGAHYDHIGSLFGIIRNGADDNASGIAVMIELARKLKLNQSDLKRSIIFVAFDAEERGLIGSTYFIDQWKMPQENIKLMISLDMVGWYGASGEVRYIGSGTIQNGDEIILNSEINPAELNIVNKKFDTNIFFGTDTFPFAVKGVPTLWAFTGFKSPYHTPRDKAHLIDYDGMALIVEHLSNLTVKISNDSDFQSSGKFAKKHKPRQLIDLGVSFNSALINYDYLADKRDKNGTVISFSTGLRSQINFGIFAIRPELYYDYISAKYPSETMSINSITVPLSLVLQTPDHWIMGLDIFFGGYYSYRFYGKLGGETMDFEKTFNRADAGITYGYNLNMMKPFIIGFTQRLSLLDFSESANLNSKRIRNRSYFTITYMF